MTFGALGLAQPRRGGASFGARLIQPGALAGGGLITLTRAQAGGAMSTALGADGATWQEFGADAPRFNGAARRLLLGGQRTNAIRNPRAENAVAGSPGTPPFAWGASGPAGLTRTLTPETRAGVPGLRVRFAGTATGSGFLTLNFEFVTNTAAAQNQTWTASTLMQGIASTGLTGTWDAEIWEFNNVPAFISTGSAAPSGRYPVANTNLARIETPRTLPSAATAFAQFNLRASSQITPGTVVEAEIWVGFPQLEQGAFASTPVLPAPGAPAASTRGADILSATGAQFASLFPTGVGTILASFVPNAVPGPNQNILQLDAGTDSNRFMLRSENGTSTLVLWRVTGGVSSNAVLGTLTQGALARVGLTFDAAGNISASFDGGAVIDLTGAITNAANLRIGSRANGTDNLFGEVGVLDALPYVIPSAALPAAVAAIP